MAGREPTTLLDQLIASARDADPEETREWIQALEAAGLDVLYDCQRGDCGICQCGVIEGVPDHRDVILSDDEKASNKVMQICVSRAKSERLVLDL